MSDNMELEEKVSEQGEKGIAMELLGELKAQNKRLIKVIAGLMVMIALIVGGFLLYLYQYDFSGTIEQSGVYALMDSDGNVISSDITEKQMEEILKIINGKSESDKEEN